MKLKSAASANLGKKALSIEEALQVVPLGRTTLYAAVRDGRLVAKKVGRRTLILITDLERFLADLPEAPSLERPE